MSNLTAVIIAGGASSRFYPLNSYLHKGGAKLLGKSLFENTLQSLAENNYKNIVVVLPENQNLNQSFLDTISTYQDQLDIQVVHQPTAGGMGDAVLLASEFIKTEQFLVTAPYHISAGELSHQLLNLKTQSAIFTTPTNTPWRYGIVSLQNHRATGIVEKPPRGTEPSNQKVQAIYLLNQKFLDILKNTQNEQYSFEIALDSLMKQTEVGVTTLEQPLPTLKFAWHLLDFMKMLLKKEPQSQISQSAQIATTAVLDDSSGAVIIGENTKIGHCARIVGPCYIGTNSLIGDFSLIRESNIDENVTVGANTEVVRSIIFENSSIHYGYMADSIIGKNNKIGAGLITANKRFDRQSIKTKVKDKIISTEQTKLGIITGEGVTIGIRASFMPGVLVGSYQTILPGAVVGKNPNQPEPKSE